MYNETNREDLPEYDNDQYWRSIHLDHGHDYDDSHTLIKHVSIEGLTVW